MSFKYRYYKYIYYVKYVNYDITILLYYKISNKNYYKQYNFIF